MLDQPLIDVKLTWDEIDALMASMNKSIYNVECHAALALSEGRMYSLAEEEQCIAFYTEILHRLGDARRLHYGYEPLLKERTCPSNG